MKFEHDDLNYGKVWGTMTEIKNGWRFANFEKLGKLRDSDENEKYYDLSIDIIYEFHIPVNYIHFFKETKITQLTLENIVSACEHQITEERYKERFPQPLRFKVTGY